MSEERHRRKALKKAASAYAGASLLLAMGGFIAAIVTGEATGPITDTPLWLVAAYAPSLVAIAIMAIVFAIVLTWTLLSMIINDARGAVTHWRRGSDE